MTLIVADTGPINYLIQIGCMSVVGSLVEKLVLPRQVWRELQAPRAPLAVKEWSRKLPGWVELGDATVSVAAGPGLSEADREAVALAKELGAMLLMDDRRGRSFAESLQVRTIGTLGLLESASARKLLDLPEAVRRLRDTTIFLPEELIESALLRDAARQSQAGQS